LCLVSFRVLYTLMMKTKESISQVFVWCPESGLPENEKNLAGIREWWTSLEGKTIIWEVFSSALDSTTPILRELLVVENPLIEGNGLRWRKRGLENWNSISVQNLVLDNSLKQLDIIPSLQDWFCSKYRVRIVN